MKYEKPTLSIEQQIAVLQTRGLIIDDEDEAKNILDKISYFGLIFPSAKTSQEFGVPIASPALSDEISFLNGLY